MSKEPFWVIISVLRSVTIRDLYKNILSEHNAFAKYGGTFHYPYTQET